MIRVISILLIGIGIALRLFAFGDVPSGLFSDEISIAVNAKAIAEDGVDEYGRNSPYAFESLSDYKMPGYIYPAAFFHALLGPSVAAVRLPALLFSLVSIVLIGYFTKLLFAERKHIGLFAMVALSLCLFHIQFSRIAYETMVATTWLLLFAIAFIKVLAGHRKVVWLSVGALAIIAATWTYPAPRFIIPVATVLFFACLFLSKEQRKNYRTHMVTLGIFVGATLISFIPSFINPLVDKRPLGYLFYDTNGTLIEIIVRKVFSILSSALWSFNLEFLFAKGDTFAFRHGTRESGVFLGIFLIPFLLGIYAFLKSFQYKNKAHLFFIVLFAVSLLPSALTSSTPYGPRFLPVILPLCVLIALGMEKGVGILTQQKQYIRIPLLLGTGGVLVYQVLWFSHTYFIHYAKNSLPEFPKPSLVMAQKVKAVLNTDSTKQIYFLTDRNCRSWSHDDLHLWYFADLENEDMITWNNVFREKRYQYKNGSPFDAYDAQIPPGLYQGRLFLYPGYEQTNNAKTGSVIIRCGIHTKSIDTAKEKITDIFYLYPDEKREAYYVVSEKL